jgi:nucleoside phosphorylase/tetratricopeptide (TPR) repeat protein
MPAVLLLCAISVEWQAILTHVSNQQDQALGQSPCVAGELKLKDRVVDVIVCEVGCGNVEAALHTASAVSAAAPELVVFVGVAGGRKDVALGDVVIGSKIYSYEAGKETDAGFQPRPDGFRPPPRVTEQARAVVRDLTDSQFKVLVAPIATGEKVVGTASGHIAQTLQRSYGDAAAVEMEGAGFARAMQDFPGVEFALVRGISDLLDNKGESDADGWQEQAAANAAETTIKLIDRLLDPSIGRTPEVTTDIADLREAVPLPTPNERYVLIVDHDSKNAVALIQAGIPFDLIIDLCDQSSEPNLFATVQRSSLIQHHVALLTTEDEENPSKSTVPWLAANGLKGRVESVSYSIWKRTRRKRIQQKIQLFGRTHGNRRTTVLVCVQSKSSQWVAALADDLITELGENCTIVGLSPHDGDLLDFEQDFAVRASPHDIQRLFDGRRISREVEGTLLPKADGALCLQHETEMWLSADMHLMSTAGQPPSSGLASRLNFLRGGLIDRSALTHEVDVPRDIYPTLAGNLAKHLQGRSTVQINLLHEPGAGGSTVARRAAFDHHQRWPTVLVSAIIPRETVRKIDWIARSTELSVLCVIDSPDISEREVYEFTKELQSVSTPAVLLLVARRFGPPSASSRALYLESKLSSEEAEVFFERYAEQAAHALPELRRVRSFDDDRRSAFTFGLTAFEHDFRGLARYVERRVSNLSPDHKDVALFTALAYFYGQQPLPEHVLAELVGLPSSKANKFAAVLPPGLRGLLWRSESGTWRPTHQLVARTILELILGPRWRLQLTEVSLRFAKFCRGDDIEDQEMRQVVSSVFFDRGNEDLIGAETGMRPLFSQLIEDIPSHEGAVELLSQVAALYPNDGHFAAHVARFYAYRLKNFERATHYADHATSTAPDSHTLHHVVGMVHRARVYDEIGARSPNDQVFAAAQEAANAFEKSRDLSPHGNEHAYISDAQMRIRVVDYATRSAGSFSAYLRTAKIDPYVVECMSTAEDLLTAVRGSGDPRRASHLEATSRTDLTRLYGNFEEALQMYDALLAKNPTDRVPIRRQIVWTHLARHGRDWRKVPPPALRRIGQLIEENLVEGHHSNADMRLWWRVVRHLPHHVSQDKIFELMSYWRSAGRGIDVLYASYVAYATDILDGISTALPRFQKYSLECSARSLGLAHRSHSIDWVGEGSGVRKLVHQSELGSWDKESQFWTDTNQLKKLTGRVVEIKGPQAGFVDIAGMRAFFVPSRASIERGRDLNVSVSGFLGFSLDGPRLWNVARSQA